MIAPWCSDGERTRSRVSILAAPRAAVLRRDASSWKPALESSSFLHVAGEVGGRMEVNPQTVISRFHFLNSLQSHHCVCCSCPADPLDSAFVYD